MSGKSKEMRRASTAQVIFYNACFMLLLTFTGQCQDLTSLDICEWQFFEGKCQYGQVIRMMSATYGRMRLGTCAKERLGQHPCSKDVLPLAESLCSGREECRVSVPNKLFEDPPPCPEARNYLAVEYYCMTVHVFPTDQCRSYCTLPPITAPNGFLSSYDALGSGCGLRDCPWIIDAPKGLRVHLQLLDFSASSPVFNNGQCSMQILLIEDNVRQRELSYCSVTSDRFYPRHQNNYTSVGNRVQIQVVNTTAGLTQEQMGQLAHFLINFTVIGCLPVLAPAHGWVQVLQEGQRVRMGCNTTNKVVEINCNGTRWDRAPITCPQDSPLSNGESARGERKGHFMWDDGLSLAIVVGVAIVVCSIVVVMGLCCMHARSNRRFNDSNRDRFSYDVAYKPAPQTPDMERTCPPQCADGPPFPHVTLPVTTLQRLPHSPYCSLHGYRFSPDHSKSFDTGESDHKLHVCTSKKSTL